MSQEESFEFELELPIRSPLKKRQKESLISTMVDEFLKNGAKKAELKDTFYVDKKSAEFLESLNLIVNVISPYATIAGLGLAIYAVVKTRGNGRVKIKNTKGKEIFLKEGMSEDEVKRLLTELDEEK